MHKFSDSLKRGKMYEDTIDKYFLERGDVRILPARLSSEKQDGFDRYFVLIHQDKPPYRCEYKADERAHETGNAFIETVSNDIFCKEGWALKSKADFIIYWPVGSGKLLMIPPNDIRARLSLWASKYKTTYAQNNNYKTHGLLVPLDELEKIAKKVYDIFEDQIT